MTLDAGFERVYTVTDYYDGPRRGIADFNGTPHLFVSEFENETQEFGMYRLSPVTDEVLELALEDWTIWRRWETAFHQGLTTTETHPALPEGRSRSLELEQLLQTALVPDENATREVNAVFKPRIDPDWNQLGARPLQVNWITRAC